MSIVDRALLTHDRAGACASRTAGGEIGFGFEGSELAVHARRQLQMGNGPHLGAKAAHRGQPHAGRGARQRPPFPASLCQGRCKCARPGSVVQHAILQFETTAGAPAGIAFGLRDVRTGKAMPTGLHRPIRHREGQDLARGSRIRDEKVLELRLNHGSHAKFWQLMRGAPKNPPVLQAPAAQSQLQ